MCVFKWDYTLNRSYKMSATTRILSITFEVTTREQLLCHSSSQTQLKIHAIIMTL